MVWSSIDAAVGLVTYIVMPGNLVFFGEMLRPIVTLY
jgi:hypothetical protein